MKRVIILPEKDGKKFFEIALPALVWVRKRDGKSKAASKQAWMNKYLDAKEAGRVWKAIWERPEWLDKYIKRKGDGLSEEAKRVLLDWRENFIFGEFIVAKYLDEGAVFISVEDGRIYLVSGITSPIEESLDENLLPRQVKTCLIPFLGHLIYNGTMEAEPVAFIPKTVQILDEILRDAQQNGKLIRNIPSDVPPPDREQWQSVLRTIISDRKHTSPEEALLESLNDPDVNILSERDLSVLDKMLEKPHRTDEDWEEIKDILLDADLFPLQPPKSKANAKRFRAVDGILCEDGVLRAFTTLEKCQAYMQKLSKKIRGRYYGINIISFYTMMETAKREKTRIIIDEPENIFKHFFLYDGETELITASLLSPK